MNRNKTSRQHDFAIIPKTEVQRSKFRSPQTRKQAFNASEIVPIMVEEVLPGDVWQHTESIMARLPTPIAPVVDDLQLETFYFWCPNRILWPNKQWEDFITGKNTSAVIPTINPENDTSTGIEVEVNSVFDHMGIRPGAYSANFYINALPIFAYFMIYNEWFRDQNLQDPYTWSATWTAANSRNITNGTAWGQECVRIGKRHDQFTASLPFAQKGSAVSIPLGTTAPVYGDGPDPIGLRDNGGNYRTGLATGGLTTLEASAAMTAGAWNIASIGTASNVYADLQSATAATINQLRLAFVTQQLLELDARGGSRYVENLLAHWGVTLQDYTAQRPVYLGGSRTPITVNPIAQTAAYQAEPGPVDSAVGNLGAEMHASTSKRTFTFAAQEHGYIIAVAALRATPTYQQGTRKHWLKQTRLEYFDPLFANLGETAVSTREIFQRTAVVPTVPTWGYQEYGYEYRYCPNEITGLLRSDVATPMDWWHYAEEFTSEPVLNANFITDKTQETLARSLATAPNAQWSAQCIMDIQHENIIARLMPAYSVPGIKKL